MRHSGVFMVGLALLGLTAPAYAQAPPLDTYGGAGEVVDEVVAGEEPTVLGDVREGEAEEGGAGRAGDERAGEVPSAGEVAGETARGGPPAAGGELPFTGLDLGLMVAGGLLLLGIGMGVRRLSRPLA